MKTFDADVVVIGAGPAGLTAAMDLDARGISTILVETRAYQQPPSVKSNHVASRTMERFRRLGVAQKIRDAGLPADYPNDIAFRTTLTGQELGRILIPSRQDRYTSTDGPDTWWPTPEPPHRINQTFLEPVLLEHVAGLPNVTLLNETEYLEHSQDGDGVEATIVSVRGGQRRTLRARYLLGCDGGQSRIRKEIGSQLFGDAVIQKVQSTYIRASGLYDVLPGKRAWCYYSFNPRRNGNVYAIDGKETFLIHNHLSPDEPEFDSVDRDSSIRTILGVDDNFDLEIISQEDWVARRLVADRFRDRRVFICGDAAHLWVPYAGFGMNAGIADVLNLTWAIGAKLKGWGGEGILDAYEAERQPITDQVSKFAMNHAHSMIKARGTVPEDIEEDSEAGRAERERVGREAYELNVQQFTAAGLNFGYVYDSSPIILPDSETAPSYSMGSFTPSTVPGCRAPHFWLPDGRSLYDAFGQGYTLLRFDAAANIERLASEAANVGMPLAVIDIGLGSAPAVYEHKLVLCREDQHVAWRGNSLPDDVSRFVDVLRGNVSDLRQQDRAGSEPANSRV